MRALSIIGAGVEPGELIEFCRNGVAQLRGTVAAFAGRAWGGADADPQFRRWRPHPQGKYPDRLLQWHGARTIPPAPSPEQFLQPISAASA
jgi:hypothetical protein